ncbi:Methylosome subunit pICln [Trichoplax sp. H2]|nr:Methylosome subunit pICln [Trichoplax sp. H2]|eukprot:RDD39782.1 Methylosome subunit pICln [Trichoplax sp. H2]
MIVLTQVAIPTENVFCKQENCKAVLNHQDYGTGTLYIAASMLTWSNNEGNGLNLEYPSISLHGVSKDLSVYPHPCIYCMLDLQLKDENGDEQSVGELILAPEEEASLEDIYNAIADCQALHPDDEDEDLEDVEEEDEDINEEGNGTSSVDMPSQQEFQHMIEDQSTSGYQDGNMVSTEQSNQNNDGQFDDADDH